jgi:hypothetical protein
MDNQTTNIQSDDNRDSKGRFAPGNPGGGRPKGSQNKVTRDMKTMLVEIVERHGVEGLWKFSKDHPVEFWRMASRLIPVSKELSGTDGGPITLQALDMPPRPKTYEEWIQQRILGGESGAMLSEDEAE